MHSISRRFSLQLVERLNQMPIRSNRYKIALYTPLSPDHQSNEHNLTEVNTVNTVFAFHIMFERNNAESAWRLVTPLKFTE